MSQPVGKLNGQTVLIFGGSSGMGKAAAVAVLRDGGVPFLISRSLTKLQAAREFVSPSDPNRVHIASVDCLDEDALEAFFGTLESGSFHHIVCTLGESAGCKSIVGKEGLAKLKLQIQGKFLAQIAPVSLGIEKMAAGGSVVLTSGALSVRPGKGSAALGMVNAALESIVKGLANDFGPKHRINCVSPGLTNTEMWSTMPDEVRTKMLAGFGANIPAGRAGESQDVGDAIGYLLGATWTTGTTLFVDGGAAVRV